MKKNEDVSDLDIDKILIEKYDLGFLLNQIKNKKITLFPSIIDVLRFIPQFNEAVKEIRKDLQIKPHAIREECSNLIGKSAFLKRLTISIEIARGTNFPLTEDAEWENVSNKINHWKKRNFPSLPQKVADMRLKVLGKAPHTWQEAIEDYILFEEISPTPLIYRRQGAEIDVKQDDRTREHYIEIKIYADTDIRYLPKINQWKKIQKSLPAYYYPNERYENLIIARFMQYVLRKHLKLTQKQTLLWLKKNKLVSPNYQHASQELRRFEELFMSTNRK